MNESSRCVVINWRRLRTIAAVLLALSISGCSTAPTRPVASMHTQPFIITTAIDFPQTLANARMVNHIAYGDLADGIDIIYRLNELPEATFDVFVYPAGRMQPKLALDHGQQVFIATLEAAREQGGNAEVDVLGQEAFEVALADGRLLPGIKTRIATRERVDSEALVSRGYLFYRHFYYIKFRVTVPASDAARLDALIDGAVRQIVPRMASRSQGECLQIGVLGPNDPRMPAPLTEQADVTGTFLMVRSRVASTLPIQQRMSRSGELGCLGRDEPPPLAPDYSRRIMQFKPGDWGPGTQTRPKLSGLRNVASTDSGRLSTDRSGAHTVIASDERQ